MALRWTLEYQHKDNGGMCANMQASSTCFSAEAETDRWRAMEGVLRLASSRSAAASRAFAGTTRVRMLADILQALDAAHDNTLIILLHCLRFAPSSLTTPFACGLSSIVIKKGPS